MKFKLRVEVKYRIVYADAKEADDEDDTDSKTGFSKVLEDGSEDCAEHGFPTKCKKQ